MSQKPPGPEPAPSRRALWTALGAGAAGFGLAARAAADRTDPSPLPLRHPRRSLPRPRPRGAALPPAGVVTLNRAAFGPRPGDLAAFEALAGTDAARIAAWVGSQLDPASIDDSAFEARLAAAGFVSFVPTDPPDTNLARLWDWYVNDNAPGNSSSGVPRDELIRTKFLRAIYSRRQLLEVVTDFWHDHFSCFIDGSTAVRATFPHLDQVIRQHAFGRFRDLLEAVARSSTMLYSLDNYTSSNAGPNENFCRELFELHTLGAASYLGVQQQNEVPVDGDGVPVGYVDADVFEATRAFTGWSFSYGTGGDGDTGLFYYRADWHDRFQKTVLGTFLPADQPDLKDGEDVLDVLASHPGTGRHVAGKLCRRLVADDPPPALVDAAAQVFTDQWQAPDQLRQVLETILLSDEFRTTWGEKVKRPFQLAVSAMRAGGGELSFRRDHGATDSFLWRFDDTGHEPFHWPAPNGFPDVRGAWTSMTPRVMSWRFLGALIDLEDDGARVVDVLGQTPPAVRSANDLADFWIDRILGRPMPAADRQQVVQFMAQGINPDFDLNLLDDATADRLRMMVGLIFMSPEFHWR